jgi:hypothetical protein
MKAIPGTPLTEEDVSRLISTELTAANEYLAGPDNIVAERDRNYDYFRGIMNDLPAAAGRSRVVDMVVANYIGLLQPNLMRIFTSGRNIAEYVSPKSDLQPVVRLITRFINDIVFRKDNRGELLLGDWALDALIQKLGVVMWWWEEKFETKDVILENIPDGPALALTVQGIQAKGEEIVEATSAETMVPGPQGPMSGVVHTLKVRTKVNVSKCCIDTIPPEEFVISRDARSMEDAVLKAHRTGVMVGDLIAAGYDPDVVNNLPNWSGNYDVVGQNAYNWDNNISRDQSADPMLRKVCVVRGIVKMDFDGTGIKEWYFVSGGYDNAPKILDIAPYNEQVGFADFCPEPLPHQVYGRCPADRLSMIQKIQTVLVRQMNDNLFLANTPQREVVMDWIVKPDQLMNMAPGAPILVKQPNAIREIAIPFVADKALIAMQYYDGQAELTTGASRNSAGLDPEVLQNQSATAAMNQQSAALGRVEMIARIWAQGGMRKLFRGVFRCIKAYQDFERVVQIDGAPTPITPELFAMMDDLDVNINTGLGTGNRERDFMVLSGIEQSQKETLTQLGPNNPIVDFKKLVKTLQLKAESAGISYPENFFGDPGNWQPEPPGEPKPTPDALVFAEVEKYKADTKVQTDTIRIQSDERVTLAKMQNDKEVALYKADLDAGIEAEKLGIERANTMINAAKVDSDREYNADRKEIELNKADAALVKAAAQKRRRNAS